LLCQEERSGPKIVPLKTPTFRGEKAEIPFLFERKSPNHDQKISFFDEKLVLIQQLHDNCFDGKKSGAYLARCFG